MKLSIIIPVFNEEKTIVQILQRVEAVVFAGITKEIIIVNDASSDTTDKKITHFLKKHTKMQYYSHNENQGKGAAVKTGISHAKGEYIIIQDADLEYDPQDIANLLIPIKKKQADIVYGTRLNHLPDFKGEQRTVRFFLHYLGNRGLSLLTSLLYGQYLTDMETCYKLFPRKAVKDMQIHARGFELEPELTAKFLKRGYTIVEVPISANPRSYEEGKKLNTITDGWKALKTLFKYRFVE